MPPGSTARPPPPAAETVANHGAESSSREYAQPAAGWCRSGSQNPARSSRCDRLAVGHAAVRTAPSPNSDRVAAPTAARKTAARLASSARINRPRNSFISARKCWKCSLIGIIFAIGCRSPFQERLSLVRQSQLTPSRLLHNQRYVTTGQAVPMAVEELCRVLHSISEACWYLRSRSSSIGSLSIRLAMTCGHWPPSRANNSVFFGNAVPNHKRRTLWKKRQAQTNNERLGDSSQRRALARLFMGRS